MVGSILGPTTEHSSSIHGLTTHKSHAIRATELSAAPPRTLQSQRPHFKPRHTCEGIACDIPEAPQHTAPQRASKAPRTTLSKKHPAGRRRLRHAQSRVANEAQGTTQARRHQRRGLITTPRMEAPPRVGLRMLQGPRPQPRRLPQQRLLAHRASVASRLCCKRGIAGLTQVRSATAQQPPWCTRAHPRTQSSSSTPGGPSVTLRPLVSADDRLARREVLA